MRAHDIHTHSVPMTRMSRIIQAMLERIAELAGAGRVDLRWVAYRDYDCEPGKLLECSQWTQVPFLPESFTCTALAPSRPRAPMLRRTEVLLEWTRLRSCWHLICAWV